MKQLRFVATTALAVALAFVGAASAQTASKETSKPAANAWMLTPTPYLEWNKDIPPAVRSQRDAFWDEVTHREWPLTVRRDGAFGGGDRYDNGTEPEIPEVPNRVILTATFTASRSVLSASEKSIYTEITMRVQDVFEDKSGSGHPISGHNITLMLNGGTVALGPGRILSDNIQPSELSLQPERSYLLVLQYHKEGDWYALEEDWDVTDGVVRANTRWGQYLAKHGRSRLNGLTVQQLGAALAKLLYGRQ